MAKKFPRDIYVKIDGDKGKEFFIATEYMIGLVDMGERSKIATYRLVSVTEAEGVVETSKPKPAR